MDVGYFISELLAQHGDVSVPGLGYFAHTRINGYYNEAQGKFYPPTYSVQFDPQVIDDETLAQYIADKKNISLASSKYFTEKFVNSVKLQAQMGEAPLGDLGCFYTQDGQLFFKPNTDISTDPDFFGYQPVTLHKLGSAPAEVEPPAENAPAEPVEPDYAAPVAVPQTDSNELRFETDEEHEAYLVDLARKRSRRSVITFVVLAALFTALVVYLVNRYDSSIFNLDQFKSKKTAKKETVIAAKIVHVEDTVKTTLPTDTDSTAVKNVVPVKDTIAKTPPVVNNNITGPRYEILAGAFKTMEKTTIEMDKYKKMGFEPHIALGVPGKKHNISLGTYKSAGEANTAMDKILNTGKLTPKQVYIRFLK
ncbi:hypothetical protein EWM62_11065 [Mucilaginibacter terrigena]|uniref:CCDC81-like prokaryotic HU domain-containing protein n=1 Tax=Mucilaginibacter terrigena TaxID=2492395 RepID=A0A4Q5LK64_9SPHI|nr:hypothetical protein [Mucilaginibacter terrigena]RYU90074.1 hypothetical protein EWM62_11065 [Mucilaginibacter terrigena]